MNHDFIPEADDHEGQVFVSGDKSSHLSFGNDVQKAQKTELDPRHKVWGELQFTHKGW